MSERAKHVDTNNIMTAIKAHARSISDKSFQNDFICPGCNIRLTCTNWRKKMAEGYILHQQVEKNCIRMSVMKSLHRATER